MRYAPPMWRVLVVALLLLWLFGLLLRALGGLIHILLLVVLAIVVYRLVTGRRVL